MSSSERLTAADYNNLLDYVKRITPIAGENTRIDYTLAGAKIKSMASGAVKRQDDEHPWKVRYHSHTETGSASCYWEVYIPNGTITIGTTCKVLSSPCELSQDWYYLDVDESQVEYDSNGIGVVTIVAHGKESAMVQGIDRFSEGGKPYVGFEAKYTKDESDDESEESKKIRAGDVVSFVVAELLFSKTTNENGGETITRTILQRQKTALVFKGAVKDIFNLVWQYDVTDARADLTALYLERTESCIGGYNIEVKNTLDKGLYDVTGYKCIVAKIESASISSGEKYILTIEDAGTSPLESDDEKIVKIKLYELDDNTVVMDCRSNLNRALVYR